MYRSGMISSVPAICVLLLFVFPLFGQQLETRSSVMLFERIQGQKDGTLFVKTKADPAWTANFLGNLDQTVYFNSALMFCIRDIVTANSDFSADTYSATNYLEELYLSKGIGDMFRLDVGKINHLSGSNSGFSPVDFFRQLNPPPYKVFGPKQRPGSWMGRLRFTYPSGEGTVIFSPKISLKTDSWNENLARMVQENDRNRFLFSVNYQSFGNFIPEAYLFYDGSFAGGYNGSLQYGNCVFWMEGSLKNSYPLSVFVYPAGFDAASFGDLSQLEYQASEKGLNYNQSIGLDYMFENMDSLSVSYTYKGEGYGKTRWSDFKDAVQNGYFANPVDGESGYALLASMYNPSLMSNQYLNFNARGVDVFFKRFNPSCNLELVCTDLSALYTLTIEYRISDNLIVSGSYQDCFGAKNSVYGEFPVDYIADLSARYFF
jgi:hypothetical protein